MRGGGGDRERWGARVREGSQWGRGLAGAESSRAGAAIGAGVVCGGSYAHCAARDGTIRVKVDLDELAEAGRVVVTHGLGVAQRLEQRVGLQQLVLQVPRRRRRPPVAARQPAARLDQVLEHAPRRLGLACARLARDQDRLVLSLLPAGTAHQSGAGEARRIRAIHNERRALGGPPPQGIGEVG